MSDEASNRFRLASLSALAEGAPVRVDIGDHPIAVVRVGDTVHAIGDTCSHADFSLSEGDFDSDDCTIECPQHGALFSVVTGTAETLPATRPVPKYATEINGDDVWVVLN